MAGKGGDGKDRGAAIWRQIEEAAGFQEDILQQKRLAALAFYEGNMAEPESEDRSTVVSRDMADSVHAVHAKIMPILKSTIVEFCPQSQEDEQGAQMESDAVAARLKAAGGWLGIWRAAFDGLQTGTGWLKIHGETWSEPVRLTYPKLSPEESQLLLLEIPMDYGPGVEENELNTVITYDEPQSGLVIDSVPPEDMIYTPRAGGDDLNLLPLIGERKIKTVGELIEDGYPREKVEALHDYDAESVDRQRASYEGGYTIDDRAEDPDQVFKVVYCVYLRERDGLTYAVVGENGSLLEERPVDYQPFVRCSPIPVPHRVEGQGMFEATADLQVAKTDILRNMVDTSTVNTLGRYGVVDGMVNMDDALSGRATGVIRMRNREAMFPLMEDNGNTERAIQALNYLDQVRGERGAEALDMTEADAQIMSASATAAAGQRAKTEAMSGWYASNMAHFFLGPVWIATHRALAVLGEPFQAKMRGKWVEVDPSEWEIRSELIVHVGQTSEQRGARLSGLRELIQLQMMALGSGGEGEFTSFAGLYASAGDWIKAANLGEVTDFLTDPESQEAQQARAAREEQAQQAQQEQLAMQKQIIALQADIERYKVDADSRAKAEELRWKYFDSRLDAAVKEAEISASGAVEMERLNSQEDLAAHNTQNSNLEAVANG